MSEGGSQVGVARARSAAIGGPSRATRRPAVDEAGVRAALTEVMDPELPMLSVVDLGIVHRVDVPADGPIRVEILPTFVGCPALELIKASIARRVGAFGRPVEVVATFEAPWTSERISPAGRAALLAAGIAPPGPGSLDGARDLIDVEPRVSCPHCGSRRTVVENLFGPTQCRTIRYCSDCRQPFEIDQVGLMSEPGRASSTDDLPATVGIIGTGTMGAGIAQVALEAGCEVALHDVDAAAVDRGRERIRDGLTRRATKLGLDPVRLDAWVTTRLDHLRPAPTVDGLAEAADLVIESAIEDLDAKRAIFRTLDRAATGAVILATNTSALSVADIAEATESPGRVIGLHFFNPAPIMALVEIVAPARADPAAVARGVATMTAWGKTPVVCADRPGFIVNRVNRPFTIEALRILESGAASVTGIDEALRAAGFPMGPFELMDLTGVDVSLAAASAIWDGLGRPDRLRPSPIQERLVRDGHLGRKTGRGFYRYDGGRRIGETQPSSASGGVQSLAPVEIRDRIVGAIGVEARLAVAEGVAPPDTIDLALRLGAGHPSGPFEARVRA